MVNFNLSSTDAYCGALAAMAEGTTFINCYAVGSITSSAGSAICGGVVGMASNNTKLTQCYSVTDIDGEIRPTFVSSTNTGSYQNQPAQNLVDDGGVDTRWIANKTDMVDGVWNIVVTTGAIQLKTIKLWNADNQTYPERRWKSMKVYGSASSDGEWTEIGSFQDLQLEANKQGLAGEITINATEEYTYYRIDVLDNEGDDYMQMADMKFVYTSHPLPVCGSSDGTCTATLCYHYGSISSDLSSPVEKADVASGRLAFLLDGSPLHATGPYFQKLETDQYPVLTGNNYVYQSIDGTKYSNTCTHRDHTVQDLKPLTCVTNGQTGYIVCNDLTCGHNCYMTGGIITDLKETTLSYKPVIVKDCSQPGNHFINYRERISDAGTAYYNVTTISYREDREFRGQYVVTYTNVKGDPVLNFHEFFNAYFLKIPPSINYYVNGVERMELRHSYGVGVNGEGYPKHKKVTVDNLKKFDIIKIVFNLSAMMSSGDRIHDFYIAQEEPTGWNGKHSFQHVAATYDCVEGGYDQHYKCTFCGNAFSNNSDVNSDDHIAPLSTFYREPLPGGHNFALSNQMTDEGLLKYTCQTTNCKALDPSHFMIPNCIGTAGVEVTTDGETYSATADNITIDDGNNYNSPVPFGIGNLTYNRYYPENVWSAWFTPFDVNASYLSANGLTPAYIEGIHNYDDNEDGTIDRTVMEIVKISNGRLLAGTPLLVRAAEGYSSQLELNNVLMKANDDLNNIHTETATTKFDFIGTYTGTTAAAGDNIYSLNNTGAMVHRTGKILPLRWYCQITQKPSFIGEETTPALARAIYIRVIGEEDQETGIRTLYHEADQTLERADGIFDLSGRRFSSPQHGKININNGKKQFVK